MAQKIGRIHTLHSLVYREYEVIAIDGQCYAGVDAFSYPENQGDLRSLECLSIPEEWDWIERYVAREPRPPRSPSTHGTKYHPVHGETARLKIEDILSRHETGCLCLKDGAYPYAIPLNHGYEHGRLYMHCGKSGKKLGLIHRDGRACYVLYGPEEQTPANVRSCHLAYESVLFFGNVRICQDAQEKERAIRAIADHYGTPHQHGFADSIEILVMEIHHATARTGRFKPAQQRNLYYWDFSKQTSAESEKTE